MIRQLARTVVPADSEVTMWPKTEWSGKRTQNALRQSEGAGFASSVSRFWVVASGPRGRHQRAEGHQNQCRVPLRHLAASYFFGFFPFLAQRFAAPLRPCSLRSSGLKAAVPFGTRAWPPLAPIVAKYSRIGSFLAMPLA